MALVSLDTMVIAWSLRKKADPGQEYRLAEAAKLLAWIESEKHRVVLSAHAVAEYLTGIDEAGRISALACIPRDFFVQPFDIPAAVIAAKIQTESDIKKIAKGATIPYQCVKCDVAIVASSIVARADFLITTDGHFKSINDGRIIVKTMSEAVQIKDLVKPPSTDPQRTLGFPPLEGEPTPVIRPREPDEPSM